jgi:ABC-type tungstate transport system permease subunit
LHYAGGAVLWNWQHNNNSSFWFRQHPPTTLVCSVISCRFTAPTEIAVHVVAQGTGQALKTAEGGDADVVLVDDPAAEEDFVARGAVSRGRRVMYNDFTAHAEPGRECSLQHCLQVFWQREKIQPAWNWRIRRAS